MKRALSLTLVLACLTCLAAPPAWSQQPSRGHRQVAGELLDLMKESQDLFDWDAIGPQMIDLYARTFTEAELRDMVAFYKTPAGRKSLEKMPLLLEEGFRLSRELRDGERQARLGRFGQAQQRPASRGDAAQQLAQGWLARATAFYDQGRWEEAKNAFIKYLEESPEDAGAMADLGICYKELKEYERAIRSFDRALVVVPGHWQALYNKIIVLGFHLDKKPEAKKLMRELQRLQPNNPDVARLARDVARL